MSRTVAITGATGLIGGRLCRACCERGWQVRALVRRPEEAVLPGVARYRCELPDDVDESGIEGADVVIHCAYTTRYRNLDEARRTNEEGTGRILELARRWGVGTFVFLSSLSAHPGARSYYGRSKHALEKRMDPAGDLVIRPGLVLSTQGGLFARMVQAVRSARIIPLADGGRHILQTIHIDDLCAAILLAVGRGSPGVLSLAEPEGIALRDLLRAVSDRLDRRPLLVPVPHQPMLWGLRLLEAAGRPMGVSSENLLGLLAMRRADTRDDLAALGISIRTALESLDDLLGSSV